MAAAAAAQAERKPSITTSSRTGGFFGPLPGQLPFRQKTPETEEDEEEESSYEYEDEEEEEEERWILRRERFPDLIGDLFQKADEDIRK